MDREWSQPPPECSSCKNSPEVYANANIDDVIWNINETPRECLGYHTPIEIFRVNLGVALGN